MAGGTVEPEPMAVLVVDDHRVFAEAVAMAVDAQEALEVVGIAGDARQALELASEKTPDVVLMDLHLPGDDGIQALAQIKRVLPSTRVVMLTADARPETLARAARAGAAGFLSKASPMADVISAIDTARQGGLLVCPDDLAALIEDLQRADAQRVSEGVPPLQLTKREREVLVLMSEGLDPSTIAKRLHLSIHTSRGYVKSILAKLGVHSQLEAVVTAVREGLLRGAPSPA